MTRPRRDIPFGERFAARIEHLILLRRKVSHHLAELVGLNHYTHTHLETIMTTVADLDQKIADLNQAVLDDEAQDDKNEGDLQATIDELRAQIAAGSTDFQPQIDALEKIKSNLHNSNPLPPR